MFHVGIDIGGTNIKAAIIEENRSNIEVLAKTGFPFTKYTFDVLCEKINSAVLQLLEGLHLTKDDLTSVGVGVPGSVDASGKVLLIAHNIEYLDAPIVDELSKYFPGKPVLMDNDANVAALAEYYKGVFSGRKCAILLTLGTGLGCGMIINGKLFNGGQNHGCEVGHLPFNYDGYPCTCGLTGCMEVYTKTAWLINEAKEKLGEEYTDAKMVIDAAKSGNKKAVDIFNTYVDNLSTIIGGLCSFIDPEIVALGGGISESGNILYDSIKERVSKRNFYQVQYDVVPAKMGNEAGVVGAAMLYTSRGKRNE